jgi:ankyrin repeat protein
MKFTPLHRACDKGKISSAEVLLQAGADPNAKDVNGATPTHWAASSGKVALLNLVLAHRGRGGCTT